MEQLTNPSYYKDYHMEISEMQIRIWGKDKYIAHCEMNAFEYRMRAGKKDGQPLELDISKAMWYENKAKELKDDN
jgi:hypothetical protein